MQDRSLRGRFCRLLSSPMLLVSAVLSGASAGSFVPTAHAQTDCDAAPRSQCGQIAGADAGKLALRDGSPDKKDRLLWKWVAGDPILGEDIGLPDDPDFSVCVYDSSASAQPRLQARAKAKDADCDGKPCWTGKNVGGNDSRWKYKDRTLTPDGLGLMTILTGEPGGDPGAARVVAKAKKDNVDMPPLPLAPPVIVQLQSSAGACWEAEYDASIKKNTPDQLKAKSDVPSCGRALAPQCNAACPAGEICADTGGACACVPTCESGAAPTCDGGCPFELFCRDVGGACGCIEACGDSVAPQCGGACEPGLACDEVQSSCRCVGCGDAELAVGEDCDDGNSVDGDGCSSTCTCNPATTPAACDLTGDWEAVGTPGTLTIVEDSLGDSTITGSTSGVVLTGTSSRSDSCGSGTANIPLLGSVATRTTVADDCAGLTFVLENATFGPVAVWFVRAAP